MMRRWVIALVVGALLAAGCGGSKGESTLTLVQGAGSAVVAEKTAHAQMTFKTGALSFEMNGQIDFVGKRSSFQMEVPGFGTVDMVSEGTTLFVRTASTGWVAVEQTGALAEQQASQGFGADPRALLDQLADAEGVKEEGAREIDGVSTTHFSGTLDFDKALKTSGTPEEQVAQVKAAAKGDLTATFDLFLDDNGLARRTVSTVKMGELGEVVVTMNLVDFGKPVDITVPAESEITRTETASTQFELNQLMQSIFVGG